MHGLHAQVLRGGEVAGDGGGGGDGGGDEVGAPAAALAALEVAVAGARRPLAGRQLVGVHRQAHRAARLAPVGAGGGEDAVEALGLGLRLHGVAAGHDHHPLGRDVAAVEHGGGGAQVLDAAVRARPDEHGVDGDVADRRAGGEAHVLERPGDRLAGRRRRRSRRATGTAPSIDATWPGFVPHVTCGRSVVGVDAHLAGPTPRRRRCAACASRRRASSHAAPCRRVGAALEVGERRVVGGDRARPWRRPRSTCCTPSSGPPSRAPRIAEPRYSMTWPMPPPVPICADDRRGSRPSP